MNTQLSYLAQLKRYLRNYLTRQSLRSQIHSMDSLELEALVRDIGVSRSDLLEEARRPFWDSAKPESLSADRSSSLDIPLGVLPKRSIVS